MNPKEERCRHKTEAKRSKTLQQRRKYWNRWGAFEHRMNDLLELKVSCNLSSSLVRRTGTNQLGLLRQTPIGVLSAWRLSTRYISPLRLLLTFQSPETNLNLYMKVLKLRVPVCLLSVLAFSTLIPRWYFYRYANQLWFQLTESV